MKGIAVGRDFLEDTQLNDGISNEPDSNLTVQQTSELTGLSEHNLRYYERVGLIKPVSRQSGSRHRRYSKDDLSRIQSLTCLRMVGMSLEEMRHYFKIAESGPAAAAELQEILSKQRLVLEKRMREMEKSMEYLEHKIEYWKAVELGDTAKADEMRELTHQLVKK